eukprot:3010662-Prymnesium_polylepis.1
MGGNVISHQTTTKRDDRCVRTIGAQALGSLNPSTGWRSLKTLNPRPACARLPDERHDQPPGAEYKSCAAGHEDET